MDKHTLKIKGQEKIIHAKENKEAELAILTKKIDNKPKTLRRDKDGYYIIIKGSVNQDNNCMFMYSTLEHLNIYNKY